MNLCMRRTLAMVGVGLMLCLGAASACTDEDTALDTGVAHADTRTDAPLPDGPIRDLPPGYVPYSCEEPGKPCNAHDP